MRSNDNKYQGVYMLYIDDDCKEPPKNVSEMVEAKHQFSQFVLV